VQTKLRDANIFQALPLAAATSTEKQEINLPEDDFSIPYKR